MPVMRCVWMGVIALLATSFTSGPSRTEAADLNAQGLAEAAGQRLLGSPAPRLVLKTIDGESIDLGELYGKKAVYLKFWATWCIPCREQMPHFERTYRTAGADLAVIAVDTGMNDSLAEVNEFRRQANLTMPIVIDDGRLAKALNLRVTPQHVVIGRDGRIQYVGHLSDQRLDAALVAARKPAAQPPSPQVDAIPVIARSQIGDRIPELTATTLDGQIFRARDANEKRPTALVFFYPWCEPYLASSRPAVARRCRQVREQIDASVKARSDIRWLGVASGLWATASDLSDYRARNKISIPLTLDESGAWFRSFGVTNVPTVIIADSQGLLVRRVENFDAQWLAELPSLVKN